MSAGRPDTNKAAPQRILAVMLEFSDWREAKPWSYLASYALLDGFEACGAEWTVLPSVVIYGDRSINPWVDARESLLEGKRFDQVWVWLTHAHYPPDFWPWLKTIAPVRVGVLMESLRYTPEEIASWDGYARRFDAAAQYARHLTHMVSFDEQDVAELAKVAGVHTRMLHNMIPADMVRAEDAPPRGNVLFLGTLYDKRQAFLAKAGLGDRVEMLSSPEAGTGTGAAFDALHRTALEDLAAGRMDAARLRAFVQDLRTLRRQILDGILDVYRGGIAVLNLPAYFKGFPGRVVEAMAAGVPMVTNRPTDRPQTQAMFEQGRHIVYYDPSDPGDLGRRLDLLLSDPAARSRMVVEARARLLERLTSQAQMADLQAWIKRTSGGWLNRLRRRIHGG